MAAKTSDWRPGPTVCRCCLSEGCYKDISTEYFWMGKREVYSEMLSETFDLSISYSKSGGPNSQSRLICEPCIARLRDAADFKRQVQECEKTFVSCLDPAAAIDDLQVSLELEKAVKVEMVMKEEKRHSDDGFDDAPDFGDDDDYDDLDDQPLTKLASKIPKKETVDVLDLLDNAKITHKRKSSSKLKTQSSKKSKSKQVASSSKEKPEPKKKKVVLDPESEVKQAEGKNKNAIDILRQKLLIDVNDELIETQENSNQGKTEKDWSKIAERRGVGPILRENSLKLIENSTMFVFQYSKSWYRCYCCREIFPGMNLLREHTETEHTRLDLEKKIINTQNKSLKVEISLLKCKICEKKFDSLPEFRHHLQEAHDVKLRFGQDLLVPFKIQTEGLKCQICGEISRNFKLLNIHMNKHLMNHICDVCGASFANLVFLNLHKTRSHKKIRCEQCDMDFESRSDKKRHDTTEHNVKFVRKPRFPCPYCDERFFQENIKMQHLVEKHGMDKPEHKCHLCTKVFITMALLNNHVKNVHQKERKHECDVCFDAFYTKSDVMRHRVTHTGEKKFSCSLCNGAFATKDSLRRHMKRNACRP